MATQEPTFPPEPGQAPNPHVHPEQRVAGVSAAQALRSVKSASPQPVVDRTHPEQRVATVDMAADGVARIRKMPRVAKRSRDAPDEPLDTRKDADTGDMLRSAPVPEWVAAEIERARPTKDAAALAKFAKERAASRAKQAAATGLPPELDNPFTGEQPEEEPADTPETLPPVQDDPMQPTSALPSRASVPAPLPPVVEGKYIQLQLAGLGALKVPVVDIAVGAEGLIIAYATAGGTVVIPEPGVEVVVTDPDGQFPGAITAAFTGKSLGASFVSARFGVTFVPIVAA